MMMIIGMKTKKKTIRCVEDMRKFLARDWALGVHDNLWTVKGGVVEQSMPKLPKN